DKRYEATKDRRMDTLASQIDDFQTDIYALSSRSQHGTPPSPALPIHDTRAPPPLHCQANHFDMPPSDETKWLRQRLRGFQLHLLGPEGTGDRAGRLPAPLRWRVPRAAVGVDVTVVVGGGQQ
ncbi:hypothetical protein THAOC_21574, partial [Thalassiosira oceanica]